ncbi:unnamed protein product [Sphenostylis stenocarpa]|uniref:PHD-type domain-containing protein n=1 Tax=Sphenostylis stenocarpa TaxID=92480 RepID=A0AA86VB50_9FABA|nr:unnamed protein product [Sphenostylis stenocarpa]
MESGVRSGGSGVVVKSRNSSGCLIVRKKGDGLGATASTSRKLYESKQRANISVSLSDSGSSDELMIPPGRRLGPETIRVCNGLAASERGVSEISRKRDRVERIRCSGEGIAAEKALDPRERKRSKLDVYDFDEYDGMGVENKRRRHLDENGVGHGGGRFMGSVHASRSGIDSEFKAGSSGRVLEKIKNSYSDRPSGMYPGDDVEHNRFNMHRGGTRVPVSSQREKFNSDESIRVQGKNGVLKVMVNKKKVRGPSEQYFDHKKPVESRQSLKTEEPTKRMKPEEPTKRMKTEETAKRNASIRPSSYLETKPVEKPRLLRRQEKKRIASRKSLSSKDSKGDEGDSDNSDTSLNPGTRNTETHKPAKKIISEDEQTPVQDKLPTSGSKEGKIKRGSGTEKQKLRERIREMLLTSGWTIDYRPRRNRDYLDAVYINPAGTAYWSIIKAYDALQKQLNDDANEVKAKGDSSSFAPIADEVLSQLTRKTRKKMEKELKKKKKKYDSESGNEKEPQRKRSASNKCDMNSTDSDSNEEKLSSFIKQGSKSMKNKMFENNIISGRSKIQNATHNSGDGIEKSLFGCDPHIHGRKSKKHGRCTLLVRSSNKGSNSESDGFVPYMGKRTILAWLIDSGTVELSQKVQYRRRKKVLLEGWITRDGIHCGCCSKILTVSKFELHAGSKLPQPYQNIYLESGVSLLQCQIDAWNRQEHSEKIGFHSVDIDGNDPNDDTCGICGDGGDLICCDGCPSTFHQSCLDIQMLPLGEWHCTNCTCKFCGLASRTSEKDDASVYDLRTCNLYHDSCTEEMVTDANNWNTSSLSFCGKECKELSEHLKKYLGTKHELEAGFSWSLIHRTDEDSEAACRGITQRVECNSKLAIGLTVMDECFLPVIDRRSGINLIRNVLYNTGSNFSRLSYGGFYTAILERGDEIIAAASIRLHGTKIAEMPFIGTRHIYRRQGMCRRLFSAIESALCSLKVEKLVIPAIAELTHTWTTVFSFTHLDDSLRQEMKSLNMMVFPGIDMLQKLLVEQGKHEGNKTAAVYDNFVFKFHRLLLPVHKLYFSFLTGSEKMGNGGNDFIHTKIGNRSDMDSSTPQDPRGSDDVTSNPTNEMNDECSDASQELDNQVLVDGTLCSKSHSEEMVSDSVSDKCISPSRTSHSALEMKSKLADAPPIDKVNPSSKSQSISPNETSVSNSDVPNVQPLVQVTDCSDPCSAESRDNKCHSFTAMNCDSSELDINPLLDSQKADKTVEAVSSRNLSEENIRKGDNKNVDFSSSTLKHADKSLLPVGSDSNDEIGCEKEDVSAVNASGVNELAFFQSFIALCASQFSRLLKLVRCALIWLCDLFGFSGRDLRHTFITQFIARDGIRELSGQMESGVRSGGSGVVVKSRNSSGCLIVRKKGHGLGATASTSRKLYDSKKRANISVSLSDSGSSDELLVPPGRRLGSETIRVCNGLAASERGGNEISRKRDRVERIRGAVKGLEPWDSKRSKLDVHDFEEYDGMDVESMRRRHLEGNGVGFGGGRFMGSEYATRSGLDREFKNGSSERDLDKRKNSYGDRSSGFFPGDNVNHNRFKTNRDRVRVPIPFQREKFNSNESIRVQGKNGVLKVMINKKKLGGPSEQYYDHHKPVESRQRLKTEEPTKRMKTEEIAKRNVPIRPSSHTETKPVEKPGLLKRPEKNQIASRKSLSSKDSKGDEGDSDNSDTSLNPRVRNTEARKPVKKMFSDDEQTPLHDKHPTTKTKEGKIKRGSGTEKQKLRERIREMLLTSGWTIDYRPRRNRDYLDAVYINPAGTAYWSIIKAYDALQKQLNDDANEVKAKGDTSFAPIADEVLSQLTRKTRKKMEKELKTKKKKYDSESDNEKEPQTRRSASNKHDMNSSDSDNNEEKLSSFIKQGSKSMKNKMFESTIISARSKIPNATHHSIDRIEKSFGCDPRVHGRKSNKHGRCTLLARRSNKGSNSESDSFVPYMGKRTVLAWLIDTGAVELSQKVQYRRRKKVLLEGWITRDGIHCGCCSKILTVSKFELHAGSKLPQPYQNIFLESGVSLLQCQIDAWNRQEHSDKIGFHSVDVDGDDPNDDTCGICADGGDLICCDGCPSTFHRSCLDIQMLPPGEWNCSNCTCKFCGRASGLSEEEEDAYVPVLHICNLCEKKYHDSCTMEMDTLPNNLNTPSLSFCGKECRELSEQLKKYLGTKHELEAGFSWSLIHRTDEDSEAACRGITQRVECNSKLAIALSVMDECFLPVIDRRSGINLIRNVLYNSGSNFNRLSYGGFYTAILERGDEIIAAASIRFHGTKLAEMPFIGTRHIYRRQGMCRRLFSSIESALCALNVEKLVIPAIAELTHMWTSVFGFTHVDESLRQEMRSLNMVVFPGIDMLQKLLVEGSEKMGNGDNDFIHTKMGNRSDMGSSTPQDPRGSDDVSSNPANNETNDECSDASQELNNQVLVDGCSKSHSEEMLSDSVSDKCVSPSRTNQSALKMKNKVVASPPVDKLNPSSKFQSISASDTYVRSHREDISNVPAVVQETSCSDPCSAENLDKECHSFIAMNCGLLELDIDPLLDSQKADNTPPTKETYMNDALEAVTSRNLSEENITNRNQKLDVSISALNHADESLLKVGSGSNCEIGCENVKDLLLNPVVSSNESCLDERGLNASGDSSGTFVA